MVRWTNFPAIFWFQLVTVDLLLALLVTVAGLWLFSAPSRAAAKGQPLRHGTASYLGEKRVTQFYAAIQVKVRFVAPGHGVVITYIYPNQVVHLTDRSQVPISYSTVRPADAYYTGPGGDAYAVSDSYLYPGAGLVLTGLGLYWSGLALNKQRRMVARARRAADSGPSLTIRAEPAQAGDMAVVIVSRPDLPWDYSWKSLPSETPVDPVVRFLRNLARGGTGRARLATAQPWSGPGQADREVRPHRWVLLRTADQLYFPKSPAEPVLGRRSCPGAADAEADDLLRAHGELLAAYADALNQVRLLPRFIRPPGRGDAMPQLARLRTLLCWRAVVRMHAEFHVRRQLRELSSAYIRRQFVAAEPAGGRVEHYRPADLAGQCKLLGESLTNGRRTASVLVILTVVVPLVPLAVKTNPVQVGALLTAILGYLLFAIVLSPGIAALTAFGDAFQCKRRLFGGGSNGAPEGRAGPSIYLLENQVFQMLGQPKKRQHAVDLWACGMVLLIWTVGATLALLESSRLSPVSLGVWLILALSAGVPMLLLARAVWRRRNAER